MKPVSASRAELVQILMPGHINSMGRLFGGRLMEWIDIVAGVVARRHANADVITASVSHLEFKSPANVGDTILLIGRIVYVGRTSMDVRVDTFVEALSGERAHVNQAYLTMVALGDDGKPRHVPGLSLENDEQRAEWDAGVERHRLRKKESRP